MDNNELMRMEIKKQVDEIRMGIQQNVIMQIKKAMSDNHEFMRKASMEAINRTVNEGKELSLGVLTKKYLELESKVIEIQHHSNPYVLSEHVRNVENRVQEQGQDINTLKNKIRKVEDTRLMDAEISAEEVKKLYSLSGCTHTEMAKYLNVDKSRFYQILNGNETKPDLKRLNDMKRYLEEKIDANT